MCVCIYLYIYINLHTFPRNTSDEIRRVLRYGMTFDRHCLKISQSFVTSMRYYSTSRELFYSISLNVHHYSSVILFV